MRLSLTGAAGIGKTTLARALAARLGVPLLDEGFESIVRAFNSTALPGKDGPRQWRANCRAACLAWLQRRESHYQTHPAFVEDRCAIDILFRWLRKNLSDDDNEETQRIIDTTRALLAYSDGVVIPR